MKAKGPKHGLRAQDQLSNSGFSASSLILAKCFATAHCTKKLRRSLILIKVLQPGLVAPSTGTC